MTPTSPPGSPRGTASAVLGTLLSKCNWLQLLVTLLKFQLLYQSNVSNYIWFDFDDFPKFLMYILNYLDSAKLTAAATHGSGRSCPSSCRRTRSRSRWPGRCSGRRSCRGCARTRPRLREEGRLKTEARFRSEGRRGGGSAGFWGRGAGTHWCGTVGPPSRRDRCTGRSWVRRCRSLRCHRGRWRSHWCL